MPLIGHERSFKMARIGVDFGHGVDTFPPSKGVNRGGKGYAEHSFNAKLGMVIKKLLEAQGHTVILGQQPNKKDVPLFVRTNLYNREKVDLILSVHANWNANEKVNGRCAFYWGTSGKSQSLAVAIRDEIGAKGYSTHGNGLHAGVRNTWTDLHINRVPKAPSVLVEYGFMSGNTDFELIFGGKQGEYIKDMAEASVRGIQSYLGETFKGGKVVNTGWKKNSVGWWYVNHDGTYPKASWKKVSNIWYYFDSKGYMMTGWREIKGQWYYLNMSGAMQTGWRKSAGKWYYLNPSGAMQTGLITVNGKHYYLNASGAMLANGKVTLEANKSGHLT